jgi:rhodanese-related sulfurtransferase
MKTKHLRCIQTTILSVSTGLFLAAATNITVIERTYADEANTKTQIKIKNISPKQAKELLEKEKDVYILDVRTEKEYDEVHLKGAHLIPVQELEENIQKIPKDKKVIIHCAKGKRSEKAYDILKDKGLKELYHLEGGIRKWQEEGYPVEKHQ